MKMHNYRSFFAWLPVFLFISCQEIEFPEFSADNTMTSIQCVVVMETKMNATGSKPEDVTEKYSGAITSNGIITFSGISGLTDEQKQRARFNAIIPLTATLVEKDGAGNIIGSGIAGLRTISKKTYYFYVIAANGTERKYVITFN